MKRSKTEVAYDVVAFAGILAFMAGVWLSCTPRTITELRVSSDFTPAEQAVIVEARDDWCDAEVQCFRMHIVDNEGANIKPGVPANGAWGEHHYGIIRIAPKTRVVGLDALRSVARHEIGHAINPNAYPDHVLSPGHVMSPGSPGQTITDADKAWAAD